MGSVIQRATGAFAPCQWGPRQLNGCSPDRPNADTAAASGAAYEKSFRIRDEGFHAEYDSLWPMYNECLRHLIEAGDAIQVRQETRTQLRHYPLLG